LLTPGAGFALPFLVFGGGLLVEHARDLDRTLRSRGWQPVPGRVLANDMQGLRTQFGVVHSPAVLYTYTVAGEEYEALLFAAGLIVCGAVLFYGPAA
jgi:hypothetical protein